MAVREDYGTDSKKSTVATRGKYRIAAQTNNELDHNRVQKYAHALGYRTTADLFYARVILAARRWCETARQVGIPGYDDC